MSFEKLFWNYAYRTYPSFLRVMEKLKVHSDRQPFSRGKIDPLFTAAELEAHLIAQGFEPAILAWKDPGELLSLRKIDRQIFQYHIRLFDDGELCCHYEYSSEGNPLGHVMEKCFEPRVNEFEGFLGHFLDSVRSNRIH